MQLSKWNLWEEPQDSDRGQSDHTGDSDNSNCLQHSDITNGWNTYMYIVILTGDSEDHAMVGMLGILMDKSFLTEFLGSAWGEGGGVPQNLH